MGGQGHGPQSEERRSQEIAEERCEGQKGEGKVKGHEEKSEKGQGCSKKEIQGSEEGCEEEGKEGCKEGEEKAEKGKEEGCKEGEKGGEEGEEKDEEGAQEEEKAKQ